MSYIKTHRSTWRSAPSQLRLRAALLADGAHLIACALFGRSSASAQ